jgi:hypothetical protein
MTSLKIQAGIAAVVVLAATLAPEANAAPITRTLFNTAAGTCTPAFGPSEVAIRKRPLSVQNEGTTNAFVTCAFTAQTSPTVAQVWVNSFDGVAHTVNCTGVSGYNTWSGTQYVIKSASVGPGTSQVPITFLPADFGETTNFGNAWFSVSCSLPPGAGVNDVSVSFPEEIGT